MNKLMRPTPRPATHPAIFAAVFAAALAFAAAASAQQYRWTDKDGRVQYGDVPPPGVSATRIGGAARSYQMPAEPAADPKPAAKGGPSAADQEAAFRKRQAEAEEQRQKQQKELQAAAEKRENCAGAKENLRAYESGQRIARANAQGERYYMDEAQVAQEAARARQSVQRWCD